ncbi:MAG: hypothetical protein AYK18_13040 [Theionarchaea archaeon DG-70]|nr:MAG: hypothetical protein AYK18_13040 [Theionarchaea archaeon DG-70]
MRCKSCGWEVPFGPVYTLIENTYYICNRLLNMEVYREEILHKESRIKILVDAHSKPLTRNAFKELIAQRTLIEEYIEKDPFFKTILEPQKIEKDAPEIIKEMAEGAKIAHVGLMAAVAGTIAEFMCKRLIKEGARIAIVENGGDIFGHCLKKGALLMLQQLLSATGFAPKRI